MVLLLYERLLLMLRNDLTRWKAGCVVAVQSTGCQVPAEAASGRHNTAMLSCIGVGQNADGTCWNLGRGVPAREDETISPGQQGVSEIVWDVDIHALPVGNTAKYPKYRSIDHPVCLLERRCQTARDFAVTRSGCPSVTI